MGTVVVASTGEGSSGVTVVQVELMSCFWATVVIPEGGSTPPCARGRPMSSAALAATGEPAGVRARWALAVRVTGRLRCGVD